MPWQEYLTDFHHARAGITQTVLDASHDPSGSTPYDWLAAALPPTGRVLDVACGSAPLSSHQGPSCYLGMDLSAAELAEAHRRGVQPLIQASAQALPLATSSIDVVICSMALMIVSDLPAALAEIRRVLTPSGRLIATIPGTGKLRAADLAILAPLLTALGRRLRYPNDKQLTQPQPLLAAAGLHLDLDETRRFGYQLDDQDAADQFLASLYLPDLPAPRYSIARTYLRSLARPHVELPIPIRRIQATTDQQ